jgi:hypothetical protein
MPNLVEALSKDEPPDLWITVNPSVANARLDEMNSTIDDAIRLLLYGVFRSKWKRNRSPLVVLVPEIESRRTKGDAHQMLHYHGFIWTKNARVRNRFLLGNFSTLLRDRVLNRFPQKLCGMPNAVCESFNPTKNAISYSAKNLGRDFSDEDIHIFFHSRQKRNATV